jgi:hypothetical protein
MKFSRNRFGMSVISILNSCYLDISKPIADIIRRPAAEHVGSAIEKNAGCGQSDTTKKE